MIMLIIILRNSEKKFCRKRVEARIVRTQTQEADKGNADADVDADEQTPDGSRGGEANFPCRRR